MDFFPKSDENFNIVFPFQTMTHAAYVYDIEHVIVDNLQFMTSYVRYNIMWNVSLENVGQLTSFIFSPHSKKNFIFYTLRSCFFAISFQPWGRSIFYPESCYFCTEEFCEHQKRACYVGHSPKKGLSTCTFEYPRLYVTYVYVCLQIYRILFNCGFTVLSLQKYWRLSEFSLCAGNVTVGN